LLAKEMFFKKCVPSTCGDYGGVTQHWPANNCAMFLSNRYRELDIDNKYQLLQIS